MINTYYLAMFIASVALTGLYMLIWHKHYDVHITLVFVLVPIVNLGFMMMSRAQNLQEAILANKIAYIGGVYLQLMITISVFTLCRIPLNRWIQVGFFALSSAVYLAVLTQGGRGLFYKSVSLAHRYGGTTLQKEYGPLHHVFIGVVMLYFLLSCCAIFYAFAKKKQVSRKILILLFFRRSSQWSVISADA